MLTGHLEIFSTLPEAVWDLSLDFLYDTAENVTGMKDKQSSF